MDGRQGPGHPGSFSQARGLDLTYEQTGMHWGNFRLSQGILYFWFEKLHFATVWSVYSGAGSRSRKEGWGGYRQADVARRSDVSFLCTGPCARTWLALSLVFMTPAKPGHMKSQDKFPPNRKFTGDISCVSLEGKPSGLLGRIKGTLVWLEYRLFEGFRGTLQPHGL